MSDDDIGPITVPRLEHCLDSLAVIMARLPDDAAKLVPLYTRLEHEIAVRRSAETVLASAQERVAARQAARRRAMSTAA